MKKKPLTLGDFSVPLSLYCHHCAKKLSKKTPIDMQKPYVVAACLKCGHLTPFKLVAA